MLKYCLNNIKKNNLKLFFDIIKTSYFFYSEAIMSIGRTVREMGLSQDDFLITGYDETYVVDLNSYMRHIKKSLDTSDTLATSQDWLGRGRLLTPISYPAGFKDDMVYYHIDDTVGPYDYKEAMMNRTSKVLDHLAEELAYEGIRSASDLDKAFEATLEVLVKSLRYQHDEFKNSVSFSDIRSYRPMSESYIPMTENVPESNDCDDDIPF